jgi:hypothetical protein
LIIDRQIIPEEFFWVRPDMKGPRLSRTEASRKFVKHGAEIKFPRYRSADEAIASMRNRRKVPSGIREERFDKAGPGFYCAYSFIPIVGSDKRKRKMPLREVAEGGKLYAYAERMGMPIAVEDCSKAERVAIDGGTADVTVPSRTPKAQRYRFSIQGIPLVDNNLKYVIANCLISNHLCPDMQYSTRYTYLSDKENSRVFNWDAHDIAAFYAAVDHYWNKENNLIPLAMSQIPLPSQRFARLYDLLRYDTVILTKESAGQGKKKMYPLNNAELEILLEEAVQKLGHRETLFCDRKRDGDLRDYEWRGM